MTHHAPIRVGLIGYGFSGQTFHAPLLSAEPGMALTYVASSAPDRVHADWPDVIVDADPLAVATHDAVDLVVIASPNDSHAPLARAALSAGKHVVVDKPFTLDLAEARDLAALADQAGNVLSVFHNRRWDSDFLTVQRAIEDGLIGTVAHFESHIDRFRPAVRVRWREGDGPGSGLWYDLGPHLVDQALRLFGLPERVLASLARQRTGALTDDWAHVVLDYGPRRVILHAGMLVAGASPRFIIHGDTGTIVKDRIDGQETQLRDGMHPGAPGWGDDPDPLRVYDADGTERTMPATPGDQRHYYAGIAAAIAGTGPNPVTPIQALAVMAVIEAGAESARTGTAVVPALTAQEYAAWH